MLLLILENKNINVRLLIECKTKEWRVKLLKYQLAEKNVKDEQKTFDSKWWEETLSRNVRQFDLKKKQQMVADK